jgi:hypothetical protein
MNLVKTFEEACAAKGLDPEKVLPVLPEYPSEHAKALIAAAKLFLIADVLNEGWKPDWNNYDDRKYYLWFDLEKDEQANPSGFRLISVTWYSASSDVGSRLCFRSREVAEHASEHFLDLYKDLMIVS